MTAEDGKEDLEIRIHESISVRESISIRKESSYLLQSHRERVQRLLNHSALDQHDIIDVLISLHIVLEVGVNTFFRQVLPLTKGGEIFAFDKTTENLDNISFGDKVAMFLYSGTFDFSGKEQQARDYHKIIGEIKRFSEMRNKLLHGHAVSVLYADGKNTHSKLSKELSLERLGTQVRSFHTILDGLAFYFERYTKGGFTPHGKQQYVKSYLDTSFLPHCHFQSE
jgi:hypothetical protein